MKAVIFDFDGVIHDTLDIAYGINRKVSKNDISLDEYKDIFNGNIYKDKTITPESYSEFFELQRKEFEDLEIKEDIRNELLKLKDEYELFIISSNEEVVLNNYLENNDILHLFERVLGVETHKSKIEKFKILFDEHGLDENNCVFVTDTLGDILEANKVGVGSIAVDFGFHERHRLEKGNPKKIVSSFEDILPCVKGFGD
ncbi:HAD family hydrolase [archaeon]|nr:HAD family hydrolase [archaeon]MBT7128409.1 HAD family hydrolase [archaeon]